MLGDPEAMIPPSLRLLSQLDGVLKGFGGGFGPVLRALIQDAQLQTGVSPISLLTAVVQTVMMIKQSCYPLILHRLDHRRTGVPWLMAVFRR